MIPFPVSVAWIVYEGFSRQHLKGTNLKSRLYSNVVECGNTPRRKNIVISQCVSATFSLLEEYHP